MKSLNTFILLGIFAPGDELEVAVRVIYTMRKCSALIRSNAFFSLVLTLSHPPQYYRDLSVYLKKVSSHPNACQSLKYQDASGSFKRKNYDNNGVSHSFILSYQSFLFRDSNCYFLMC